MSQEKKDRQMPQIDQMQDIDSLVQMSEMPQPQMNYMQQANQMPYYQMPQMSQYYMSQINQYPGGNVMGQYQKNQMMGPKNQMKLQQIQQLQQAFDANKVEHPYPMYPNYGKITKYEEIPLNLPEQRQLFHPGVEGLMVPRPIIENPNYKGSGKLKGKVALITGGAAELGRRSQLHLPKKART